MDATVPALPVRPPSRPPRSPPLLDAPTRSLLAGRQPLPPTHTVILLAMSAAPSYPAQYPAQPPLAYRDNDTKAPYDDLIDQYATPYGTPTPKTYAVDPAALTLTDSRPSYALPKQSYSSEFTKDSKSLEDHGPEPPDWEYPPLTKGEKKEKEKDKSWRSVRAHTICFSIALYI